MSDDGNVLPQAEIDAIFKEAAERNLEARAAKEKIDPLSVLSGKQPKESKKAKITLSDNSDTQPASSQKAGTDKSTEIEKINEIMDVLGKLTLRIENLENNITDANQSKAEVTDNSELERRLLEKINNEESNLHKIEKRITNILARLKETPGYGARGIYTCSSCGSHGYMAVPVKCSRCGTQGWLGWWPE